MKRKKQIIDLSRKFVWLMIAISFILFITDKVYYSLVMTTITFFTVVAREIYQGIVWRCPGCDEYLGKYTDVKYCSRCRRDIYR